LRRMRELREAGHSRVPDSKLPRDEKQRSTQAAQSRLRGRSFCRFGLIPVRVRLHLHVKSPAHHARCSRPLAQGDLAFGAAQEMGSGHEIKSDETLTTPTA
jgi:hypothetical protein